MTFIQKVKQYLFFIPLLLAGWVYYLIQQTKSLQGEIDRKDAEKEMAETLANLEEAKKDADKKEADYRAARDALLARAESDDGGDGNLF
jgi:hypothetical protein